MPLSLTETEKAYIAGIIDGEGSISIWQNPNGSFSSRLSIYNTSELLMTWLQDKLNKVKYTFIEKAESHEHHKDWFDIMFHGTSAKEMIALFYPYLVAKKRNAEVLMAFPICERGKKLSKDEHLAQALCSIEMKRLNKRGKDATV